MSDQWFYAVGQNRVGPMPLAELVRQLPSAGGLDGLVFGPGMTQWMPARHVPPVAQALGASMSPGMPPPPPPPMGKQCHDIDYEVFGSEMQYVVVTLDQGQTVVAEPGSMMFMTPGIEMQTFFGDPNKQSSGLWDKLKTVGKRLITGESMFMTTFTNSRGGREQVAFAAPYPGKILPMDLGKFGNELICQKDSFLAAAKGTDISIAFQKKIGVGLFGGEGFIMQRLRGDGIALVHAGGSIMERDLAPGEQLKIDTGCIVAFTSQVQYDVQFVGGFKNTLFGGEGLFFALLTGPGRIWLQSLPFSRLAGRMAKAVVTGKGEGSILGGFGTGDST